AAVPAGALVPSPLGPVEPEVVAEIRALEAVAHGWDLGVALGRPLGRAASYDVDLEPLVGATDRLRAGLEVTRPGNTAYGTAIEVADDAPTLDRLLARLGRRV
ncbi:MAG: hypothetical protein Q7T52_03600, partial [Nocardioides sp.]|nr:hypothetical protein [Nocardioides sp.]